MSIGQRAMILAAGLGQRMRPITDTTPKPLVKVGGKRLIDYSVDALRAARVPEAIVNVHHLASQIEDWAETVADPRLTISDERAMALETGGGIAKALPLLGADPFFVLNGDGFWIDDTTPALLRLREQWRDHDMDCLLLLAPISQTIGFDGAGDFSMESSGVLRRYAAPTGADDEPLVYIGGYLVHPRLFRAGLPERFSMNLLWSEAIARRRLHGVVHKGRWFHVGTPEAIILAESRLTSLAR
jgi:N-acetyl-alpha-D-muramate 1-phosphate uridylyltransferase